jgi:tetratricopeptide (TPR) repeat protein
MSRQVRLQTTAVWDALTFVLNGIVFVLIGLQLPYVTGQISGMSRVVLLEYGVGLAKRETCAASRNTPKSARIQYELGGVEEELHRPERALEAYERSVALDPYSPTALLNLGDTYAVLHRYDDAIKTYRVVITLKPTYGKAYYNLGNVFSDLKRHEEARRAYVDAV